MERNQPPSIQRPLWVKVALWGSRNRTAARSYVWQSTFLAISFAVLAYMFAVLFGFYVGVLFGFPVVGMWILFALWYWSSIRWVDQHDGWS